MIDDMGIELRWQSYSLAEEYGEPDDAIYVYDGSIFGIDEHDERTQLGRFRAQYVDVGRAVDAGLPVFEVLDCHSSSTPEYFEPIFGANVPDFSDVVESISAGGADGCNLLILDRVEILPKFRGRYAGLQVLRHMMVRFSAGAGVIALKAFPLQFESAPPSRAEMAWRQRLALDGFVPDMGLSTAKLQCYYEKLGFRALPDSAFMIFATGWKVPSMDAVCSPRHAG